MPTSGGRLRRGFDLAGYYAGEAAAFAAGVSVLTALAGLAAFLVVAGLGVVLLGFIAEEWRSIGRSPAPPACTGAR